MSWEKTRKVTLAPAVQSDVPLFLIVVGERPKYLPYLSIREAGQDGRVLATVDNARSLRALAHRILHAIGDEP